MYYLYDCMNGLKITLNYLYRWKGSDTTCKNTLSIIQWKIIGYIQKKKNFDTES